MQFTQGQITALEETIISMLKQLDNPTAWGRIYDLVVYLYLQGKDDRE